MNIEKEVLTLKIDEIIPNRFQPRIKFKEENINELAESIKEHGVIQPIVVRKVSDKYEIIAGERRYKASVLAGKTTIPAIVTDLDDKNSAEIALIENVQRQNLTPIEEAISYKKILDMGYINQTDLAEKLGKTQSTIANKLRLLNLDEEVQEALLDEKISERHARSLLKLERSKQLEMLNRIISERMTVRKTDDEINKMLSNDKITESNSSDSTIEKENIDLEKPMELKPINDNDIEIIDLNIEKENESEKKDMNEKGNNNNLTIESMHLFNDSSSDQPTMVTPEIDIPNSTIIEEPSNQTNPFGNIQQDQSTMVDSEMNIPNSTIIEEPTMQTNPFENIQQDQPAMVTPEMGIPSNNPTEDQPKSFGKFFNMFNTSDSYVDDVEEKEVNMNFEQPKSTSDNTFNFNFNPIDNNIETTQIDNNTNQNDNIPMNDINSNQISLNEDNNINKDSTETMFTNTLNPYTLNDNEEFTNTSSSMAEINPSNVAFVQQEEVQPNQQQRYVAGDLKTVINTIRNCADTIEKYGFEIDTEEFDFEDSYQVTFRIEKK